MNLQISRFVAKNLLVKLFISYTDTSPSLIVILREKQLKTYFLIYSSVYDDIIKFEVRGFMKNTKPKHFDKEMQFVFLKKKFID